MDIEVEMYFTSRSVKLLAIGAAAALHSGPRQRETVYAFMQRAAEYGAKFYACPQALDEHGIAQADFIPEVTGVAGAAAFLGRCMDDQWVTVTYPECCTNNRISSI